MERWRMVLPALAFLCLVASASATGVTYDWPGMTVIRNGGTGAMAQSPLVRQAVRGTLTIAPAQVAASITPYQRAWSVAAGAGRRYGGVLLIGATVVTAALQWYYDQAQLAASPSLDAWWGGPSGMPTPTWGPENQPDGGQQTNSAFTSAYQAACAAAGVSCALSYIVFQQQYSGGKSWITVWLRNAAHGTIYHYQSLTNEKDYGMGRYYNYGAGYSGFLEWGREVATAVYAEYLGTLGQAIAGEPLSLDAHLAAHPNDRNVIADTVFPAYVEHGTNVTDPHTWPTPYGARMPGVSASPAMNRNTWSGDPYSDSTVDSDGDGVPDWAELRHGTDPHNPGSRPSPTGDADRDGHSNQAEWDALTDPLDPTDYPSGTPNVNPDAVATETAIHEATAAIQQLDSNIHELLAGVSTSALQTEQLAEAYALRGALSDGLASLLASQTDTATSVAEQTEAVRDLLEELQRTEQEYAEVLMPAVGVFAAPDLSTMTAWAPDLAPARTALQEAAANSAQHLDGVFTAAQGKFPFGFVDMLDVPDQVGSECLSVPLTLMGVTETMNLCDSPLDPFLVTFVRPLLIALMTFGLIWWVMEWVRQS
jgi:hypothetical protein